MRFSGGVRREKVGLFASETIMSTALGYHSLNDYAQFARVCGVVDESVAVHRSRMPRNARLGTLLSSAHLSQPAASRGTAPADRHEREDADRRASLKTVSGARIRIASSTRNPVAQRISASAPSRNPCKPLGSCS